MSLKSPFDLMKFNLFCLYRIGGLVAPIEIDSFEMCEKTPRPRHIKTHLPLFLLPDKIWSVKPKVRLGFNFFKKKILLVFCEV